MHPETGQCMLLKNCIEQLIQQRDLSAELCQQAVLAMLEEEANTPQITAFLIALRCKKPTADELAGMISAFRQKMQPVHTAHKVLDIVGTGGDGANTVNISTGSAILAASCGIKIAKHGNRAVSSLSGSADVLEALGIAIELPPDKIAASIDEIGIGFCFAPNFHPAMQKLRNLRQQLNIPTIVNILGPLLNPATPHHLLLGVFDDSISHLMADSLAKTNIGKSMVVHGQSLDEISCLGPARILEITSSAITEYTLDPADYNFPYCRLEDLQGGNAQYNAELLVKALSPQHYTKQQAIANTFILNSAVALYLYGKHNSIVEAVSASREHLLNGSALKLLEKWREFSHAQ